MSSKALIIDRIEGDFAVVLHKGVAHNIPKALLPKDIQEGGNVVLTYTPPDSKILDEAKARLNRLKKRDSGQKSIDL